MCGVHLSSGKTHSNVTYELTPEISRYTIRFLDLRQESIYIEVEQHFEIGLDSLKTTTQRYQIYPRDLFNSRLLPWPIPI